MPSKALVLGGGGVAGIAWMTGLLLGLKDAGVELNSAERIFGTSAGSTVAAQISGGDTLDALFSRQHVAALQTMELSPDPVLLSRLADAAPAISKIKDPLERLREIGRLALTAATVDEAARRAVIFRRLGVNTWPDRALTIVAIDAETGDLALFDQTSGVSLLDAVAASCAVPGVWPAVTIKGRRYIDGGARSSDNADLALGYSKVAIVSPLGSSPAALLGEELSSQTQRLQAAGAEVFTFEPDPASRAAIGLNPLDPETRAPAAAAGRVQGRMIAAEAADFWR